MRVAKWFGVLALLGVLFVPNRADAGWAWVRDRVNLRTSELSQVDSTTLTFSTTHACLGGQTQPHCQYEMFTQPISTNQWAPAPMNLSGGTAADSVLWADIEVGTVASGGITASTDTMYITTQCSFNGYDWTNVQPTVQSGPGDDILGNGPGAQCLPFPGTNHYCWKLRQSFAVGWPWGNGPTASSFSSPSPNQLQRYPFLRFIISGDYVGTFEAYVGHWVFTDKKPVWGKMDVPFHHTNSSFTNGYYDSTTVKYNRVIKSDTTAAFSLAGFTPLIQAGNSLSLSDTAAFFRVLVFENPATTLKFSGENDTCYAKIQVSYNGTEWCEIPASSGTGNFIKAASENAYHNLAIGNGYTENYWYQYGCQVGNLNALASNFLSGDGTSNTVLATRSMLFGFPLARIILMDSASGKGLIGEYRFRVEGWKLVP